MNSLIYFFSGLIVGGAAEMFKLSRSKINLFLILALAIGLLPPVLVLAHPGGLDKLGCHKCAKNCAQYGLKDGEYHCHNNSPLLPAEKQTSSAKPTAQNPAAKTTTKTKNQTQNVTEIRGIVSSVVDGDTIYVAAGWKRYKVRLIGLDAPELKDKSKIKKCLAKESKKYLEKFIKDKFVILKSDPLSQDQDKYKRLLRYVYLNNGTLVNAELVKNGYARAYTFFSFQYIDEFGDFESQAREGRLNIWGGSLCFGKQ